jgi:Cu/Ag efflux protein CusF
MSSFALGGLVPQSQAQAPTGAPAAFQRVQAELVERFKNMKLTGDPDRDFAALLIAINEQSLFLARSELDYGGDRQLRETAQRVTDTQQKLVDELKEWEARRGKADYKAQPNQPPPGSGPLDQQVRAAPAPRPASPSASAPAADLPLVSARVEDIDTASGKVTLDHGPIPNLNMDGMTMAWKVADPAMLKSLKKGEKVQFSADRVNGSLTVTRIQKAK